MKKPDPSHRRVIAVLGIGALAIAARVIEARAQTAGRVNVVPETGRQGRGVPQGIAVRPGMVSRGDVDGGPKGRVEAVLERDPVRDLAADAGLKGRAGHRIRNASWNMPCSLMPTRTAN
jgi:hypothetical protein